ncbi:MAG: enoyl-CoA hydratase-related protein [Chloroflexota bacterium]
MPGKAILYSCEEHVAIVTLNRPERGNLLGVPMAQELAEVCARIDRDEEVHAVIITGAGDAFCQGAAEDLRGISPAGAVAAIRCPVLAALNGDALGQGLELALSCDVRLAAATARLGLPAVAQGEIPSDGGTQRLPRIVGRGKALELLFTGEIITAPAAEAIGLVSRSVPPEELMPAVRELARNLADRAPYSLKFAKEAVNKGMDLTLEQGLRLEADLYFLLQTTADRTEGIRAFLEKRQPRFRGE